MTPAFRMYNPRKVEPSSRGASKGKGRPGSKGGGGGSPFKRPSTVPFGQFLMMGLLLHQAVSWARRAVRRWRHRRGLAEGEGGGSSDEDGGYEASVQEEQLRPQVAGHGVESPGACGGQPQAARVHRLPRAVLAVGRQRTDS